MNARALKLLSVASGAHEPRKERRAHAAVDEHVDADQMLIREITVG